MSVETRPNEMNDRSAPTIGPTVLTLRNVSKSFGSKVALDSVSLSHLKSQKVSCSRCWAKTARARQR